MSSDMQSLGAIGVDIMARASQFEKEMKEALNTVEKAKKAFEGMEYTTTDVSKALDEAGRSAKSMKEQMKAADKTALMNAATYSTVALGIKRMVSNTTNAFAEYEKAVANAQLVFNGSAQSVIKDMTDMARSARYTSTELIGMAGEFQIMLTGLGQSQKVAKDYAIEFARTAVDLATYWGRPLSEGVRSLQTAIYGRTESLRRMGVGISNAIIKERALSMGYADQAGNATLLGKSLAILALTQERMSLAMDYARNTSGLLINKLRGLRATWTEFMVEFGKHLAVYINPMIDGLTKLLEVVTSLMKNVPGLGKALSGALLGLGTLATLRAGGAIGRIVKAGGLGASAGGTGTAVYTATRLGTGKDTSKFSQAMFGVAAVGMIDNVVSNIKKVGDALVLFMLNPLGAFKKLLSPIATLLKPLVGDLKGMAAVLKIVTTALTAMKAIAIVIAPLAGAVGAVVFAFSSIKKSLQDSNVKKMFDEWSRWFKEAFGLDKEKEKDGKGFWDYTKATSDFMTGFAHVIGVEGAALIDRILGGQSAKALQIEIEYYDDTILKGFRDNIDSTKKANVSMVESTFTLSTRIDEVADKLAKHANAIEKITQKYRPDKVFGEDVAKDMRLAFESKDMRTVSGFREDIYTRLGEMPLREYEDAINELRNSLKDEVEDITNVTYRFALMTDRIMDDEVLSILNKYEDVIKDNLSGDITIDNEALKKIADITIQGDTDALAKYFNSAHELIGSGFLSEDMEHKLGILSAVLKDINLTEPTDGLIKFIEQVAKAISEIDIKIEDGKEVFGGFSKEKFYGIIDDSVKDAENMIRDMEYMFQDINKSYNETTRRMARPELDIFDEFTNMFDRAYESGDEIAVKKFLDDFNELTKDLDNVAHERLDHMIQEYYMDMTGGFFQGTADYDRMFGFLDVMKEYESAETRRQEAVHEMKAELLSSVRMFGDVIEMIEKATELGDPELMDAIARNIADSVDTMDARSRKELFTALEDYYEYSGIEAIKDVLDESRSKVHDAVRTKMLPELGMFEGFTEDLEAAFEMGDMEVLTKIGKNFANAILKMDEEAQFRINDMLNEYLSELGSEFGDDVKKLLNVINTEIFDSLLNETMEEMSNVSTSLDSRLQALSDYEWQRYDRQMKVDSATVRSAGESSSSMALNRALSKIDQPESMSPEQREMHEMKMAQYESVELQRRLLFLQQQHLELLMREEQATF